MEEHNAVNVNITVGENKGAVYGVQVGAVYGDLYISWRLIVPANLLESPSTVAATRQVLRAEIDNTRRELAGQNTERLDAALFGPELLDALLDNYQIYLRRRMTHGRCVAPPQGPNLPNVDQEFIKTVIRQPEQNLRVIELSGPSGIGKSEVIKGVLELIQRDLASAEVPSEAKWLTATTEPKSSFAAIMRGFAESLGYQQDVPVTVGGIAAVLASVINSSGIRNLLFFVDGVDKLDDDLLAHLVGDEGPAGDSVLNLLRFRRKPTLRLVITDRRMRLSDAFCERHNIKGVVCHSMNALELKPVRELVRAAQPEEGLSDADIDDYARAIFDVTGGHPGAVSRILQDLEARTFTVLPATVVDDYRSMVLEIAQTDILDDMKLTEYLALNVLSVFRRFDLGIVRQLIQEGLLPINLIESTTFREVDVARWLKQAQQSPAHIRHDAKNDLQPYSVHPVLRHVLPMDLKEKNLPRYLELQRHAFAIYDRRLQQMDQGRIRLQTPLQPRCTYTLEALYHLVQLQLHSVTGAVHPTLVQRAKDYWELAHACYDAEPPNSGRNPYALQSKWDNDSDLHEAIAQLPSAALLRQELDKILNCPFE